MVYEVKREEATQEQWEEMKKIARENVCGVCGAELQIRTNPEKATIEVGCLNREHHGYMERETYTQMFRRGAGAELVIKDKIEKRMLPGGYPLGVALSLIKVRFPRADMDDPSAALFLMDCMRLDLDPLLGEIVPVTFKSTDKATGEIRKVVTPILTEDGWLSLCARACPDRWIGPPITEPVTDKAFKKDLCDEEDAWVWKATGKTKDGTESVTYGWLKRKDWERAKIAGTPAGQLPGNQARVRAIKRWVRETFPEAKAKMKEITAEWMKRGEGIQEVHDVIEAEYRVVIEAPKGGEKPAEKVGAAAPIKSRAQATKPVSAPATPSPPKRQPSEIKPENLPDATALENISKELWGISPANLWPELNYKDRRNFEEAGLETPWECFLKLKRTWDVPPEDLW